MFRRLAASGNILKERQRIIDEINLPGPSSSKINDDINRIRAADENLMTEILPETEKAAMLQILDMFPDVDPHFVLKELAEGRREPDALADYLSRGSYPKYKERLEKQRKEERRRQFLGFFTLFCFFSVLFC